MILFFCIFWIILVHSQFVFGVEHEKNLQQKLTSSYNRLVRPVAKNSDKLVVKLGIKLIQIISVEEKDQILVTNVWLKHLWKDLNLVWDPANFGNLTTVSIPSSAIWVPDIILYNSADGKYEITLMTRAKVDYKGNVDWEPPAIYKSSCTINVEFFPFDQQHCAMKFGSWTYDGQQVDLVHISQNQSATDESSDNYIEVGMDLYDFYQSHEWDIMSVPARRSVELKRQELFPDITFNITLRRKTLFYTVNLIIPCVGISFLTVLTFYLPSESGEKISLCISILLSLTVFVLLLNDLIPPTSLVVPLIGKYLSFTFILVSLSVLVTVIVLNVHFRSPKTHEMPSWTKSLFLYVLPKILLMKRPPITNSISASRYVRDFANSFLNENSKKEKKNGENYYANLDTRLEKFNLIEFQQNIVDITNVHKKNRGRLLAQHSNTKSNSSLSLNFLRQKALNRTQYEYLVDKMEAIGALNNVVKNLKEEHEENRIRQEWRYTALVIDRLFLLIFTTSCIVGTISIILQAPSFYDKKMPIDQLMSKHFKKP